MADLDPLELRRELRGTLERYIATSVPISTMRAPRLATAIRQALSDPNLPLVLGPFLESLPDFEKGESIGDLVDASVLTPQWRALAASGFESLLHRPLHRHQECALRLAHEQRNYVVATGTGSGKTESFLYPVIDRLLRSNDLHEPGVRAVLVYPLNALANDQLYFRIAPLLIRQLGNPGITFGRFTGQVRSTATREQEQSRLLENEALVRTLNLNNEIPATWLLSRAEMLASPPHILITNYAMLEHLLLLPRNAPLFRSARLQFLVLDEIHTYAGAQAIEVAFLIRKLKTRLRMASGQIRVIGTSASLDAGRGKDLVRFAEDLFGEPFGSPSDYVVTGNRQLHSTLRGVQPDSSIDANAWIKAGAVASELREREDVTTDDWNELCEAHRIDEFILPNDMPLGKALVHRLSKNREIHGVAVQLERGLLDFEQLAKTLFPTNSVDLGNKALHGLVATAVLARSDADSFPILPARYHLAASGIEGGVVRLNADEPEGWSDFKPKRSHEDRGSVPYYRVLACRNCGEPYFEGWRMGSGVSGKPTPSSERFVFRIDRVAGAATNEIESEDEEDSKDDHGRLWINAETGGIAEAKLMDSSKSIYVNSKKTRRKNSTISRSASLAAPAQAAIPNQSHPCTQATRRSRQ